VVEKILVKREDLIPPFFPVEKQWKTVEKLNICVEMLGNLWGKTEAKNKNCKQLYRGLGNRNTGNCHKSQEDFPYHSVPVLCVLSMCLPPVISISSYRRSVNAESVT
jgi:hypothetical protein